MNTVQTQLFSHPEFQAPSPHLSKTCPSPEAQPNPSDSMKLLSPQFKGASPTPSLQNSIIHPFKCVFTERVPCDLVRQTWSRQRLQPVSVAPRTSTTRCDPSHSLHLAKSNGQFSILQQPPMVVRSPSLFQAVFWARNSGFPPPLQPSGGSFTPSSACSLTGRVSPAHPASPERCLYQHLDSPSSCLPRCSSLQTPPCLCLCRPPSPLLPDFVSCSNWSNKEILFKLKSHPINHLNCFL